MRSNWSLETSTPPLEYPVTLGDVYEHLRLNSLFNVLLNAASGAAQPNPDRIFIADQTGFVVNGVVWVSDTATPAGEIARIKSIAATYLETHAALTGNYTIANGAAVYADAEESRYLTRLIAAATRVAEEILGQALIDRINEYYQDWFDNPCELRLPFPPLDSVVGIYTTNTANVETEFLNTHYWVDTTLKPGRIVLNYGETWPTGLRDEKAIRVRYIAGYGAYVAVPEWIKQILLEIIAYWYSEREGGISSERSEETRFEVITSKLWQDAIAFY